MVHSGVGIDFGTTNSSIARRVDSSTFELVRFPFLGGATESYRSLLYLENVRQDGKNRLVSWTGPTGIEHYLSREAPGRLIQSLKSFLTSRTLQSTEVFGRRVAIEDLIARILRDLREKAEQQFGIPITSAVAGRPVRSSAPRPRKIISTRKIVSGRLIILQGFTRSSLRWSRWRRPIITNPRSNATSSF
jgi:molecular chaperone DnaK (HSP70)